MSYKRAIVLILDGEFAVVDPSTGEVVAQDSQWVSLLAKAWGRGYVAVSAN